MNKRDFVLGGCTTLAAGAVVSPHASAEQSGLPLATRRLERLPDLETHSSVEAWRKYVGERFVQLTPDGKLEFVLRGVARRHADEHGEQFTLLFASATETKLPGTSAHRLRHQTTGQQIPMFLQTAGAELSGFVLYRADFNRSV